MRYRELTMASDMIGREGIVLSSKKDSSEEGGWSESVARPRFLTSERAFSQR
jgi:hypothetical protein